MTYRKIKVNDLSYEYVVGKSHTKIKGLGTFSNSAIGQQFDIMCHCGCGMSLAEAYGHKDKNWTVVGVTPANIKDTILKLLEGLK
jgi:hypothetical protein